ncbi:MAG: VpsF family polysaccharide biosynthesis protein [Rhodobacteraceae bacterium]|nr:VpsF family polysaccharide biosynthesis protein [Paracoccaceae bacterium]
MGSIHQTQKPVVLAFGLSGWLFLIGLALRLGISNGLLDQAIAYSSPGGALWQKIHPGTWLIMGAFLLRRKNSRVEPEFLWLGRAAWAFLIVLSYATFAMILRSGPSSVAYLLDTYFAAVLAGLYLTRARASVAAAAFRLIVGLALINSVIALFEILTRVHMLPDPGFFFSYFRAYAVFGHPLLNALITGTVALFVLSNRSFGHASSLYFMLAIAAILAFGARAALAFLIPVAILPELASVGRRIRARSASLLALVTVPMGSLLIVAVTGILVFQTRFGERILGMADLSDNSVGARLRVLSIYQNLPPTDFWFGISASAKRVLIEQNPYFSTIENFWVDMSLSFGMLSFSAFVVFFLAYMVALAQTRLVFAVSALGFFLLVASTNNSLSVKSPALLVLVALIVAARQIARGAAQASRGVSPESGDKPRAFFQG